VGDRSYLALVGFLIIWGFTILWCARMNYSSNKSLAEGCVNAQYVTQLRSGYVYKCADSSYIQLDGRIEEYLTAGEGPLSPKK
jgi:hypothetical protein